MNFDELTRDEFYGLLRLVDAAAARLGALRAAMDQGHAKARAAQVEYENAHNELGRAMLRIQVRQMFREGAGMPACATTANPLPLRRGELPPKLRQFGKEMLYEE